MIVGVGPTAAVACRAILASSPNWKVDLVEMNQNAGGRFQTSAHNVDTGAQYLTKSNCAADHIYRQLLNDNVIQKMKAKIRGSRAADAGSENYVAKNGIATVVKSLLKGANSIKYGTQCTKLCRRGDKWNVVVNGDQCLPDLYDAVILTPPVPQSLKVLEAGEETQQWLCASGVREALRNVEYSRRFAVSLCFSPSDRLGVESAFGEWPIRYTSKEGDGKLVYLAFDSAKRCNMGAPKIVAHSSVPYGIARIPENDTERVVWDDIKAELVDSVFKLLPSLPQPTNTLLDVWRISQVREPLIQFGSFIELTPPQVTSNGGLRVESNDVDCLYPPDDLCSSPPSLFLAGDAFSLGGSRFDSCVESGEAVAAALVRKGKNSVLTSIV